MADTAELRMNVTSIKRVDPYVKEILATATHVALYKFNLLTNEWERTDTEGALFIYSRNGEPFHSIMVMNRLNTNNVIEPIVKDFDYQMQVPFLLYRNSKSKIFGIWFFNREECIHITFLIETIMENIKDKSNSASGSGVQSSSTSTDKFLSANNNNSSSLSQKKENGVDIFSLLSKAQEDFNKTPTKQQLDQSMGPAFSTPRVSDCTSKSVMDFFAKASTKSTQKPMVTGGDGEIVLQRLMSNPAHSVEHIEKQQRSITPQEQVPTKPKPIPDRRSVPITFPCGNSTTVEQTENGITFPTRVSPASSPLAFLLQGGQHQKEPSSAGGGGGEHVLGTSPFAQFLDNSHKPQLMTPMMFTASSISPTQEKLQNHSTTGIISGALSATQTTNTQPNKDQIDLLTEKQLAQALIHLLKTNSNFTRQIHEAYVESIMAKVNLNANNSLI